MLSRGPVFRWLLTAIAAAAITAALSMTAAAETVPTSATLAADSAGSTKSIGCTHVTPAAKQHCAEHAGTSAGGGSLGNGGNGGSTGGGGDGVCQHFAPPGTDCFLPLYGWWDGQDNCWYHLQDPQTQPGDPRYRPHPPGTQLYDQICQFNDPVSARWVLRNPETAILAAPPPGFGGIDELPVAADAINGIDLDAAVIGLAPLKASKGGAGLVGLPVWMWTDKTPNTWGPTTFTARVPGLAVTATANAQQIEWDMGNGATVTCKNPGTVWVPADQAKKSPDCGYIYPKPSYQQPGGIYTVTATTTFMVTWTATDGASGFITVEAVNTSTVKINELEVVLK